MEFHKFVRNKNELEKGLNSEVAKFADDTVLFRVIKMEADCEDLQEILMMLRE